MIPVTADSIIGSGQMIFLPSEGLSPSVADAVNSINVAVESRLASVSRHPRATFMAARW